MVATVAQFDDCPGHDPWTNMEMYIGIEFS